MSDLKVVSEHDRYEIDIRVRRVNTKIVNPNGRGYEADNKTITETREVIDVTTKARTLDGLRTKAATILDTLDGTE